MTHRVLIVDDHDAWRRHISSLLEDNNGWRVVGEASDGSAAVQEAERLRPDLILLDLELPGLNGIQAARRMVVAVPESKILFISAHRSLDIVEAAFSAGARGYVLKLDAGQDLLPAMQAVVNGKRFIGASLTGRSGGTAAAADDQPTRHHEVGFYADDASLLDGYARFAETALNSGKSFIFVAGAARQVELRRELERRGVDVGAAIDDRRYVTLGVDALLSTFMVDDWPDETRFWKAGMSLIVAAAKASQCPQSGVAACGDAAATLMQRGNLDAAVRLERLWDELLRCLNLEVFCGYRLNVGSEDNSDAFERICTEHSAVHSL
jgi:DNA-binding NarL/FixJ family response regulator